MMHCPHCKSEKVRVTHTLPAATGRRRRYQCLSCRRNFNVLVVFYYLKDLSEAEIEELGRKAVRK
jgi:transposase-like protein